MRLPAPPPRRRHSTDSLRPTWALKSFFSFCLAVIESTRCTFFQTLYVVLLRRTCRLVFWFSPVVSAEKRLFRKKQHKTSKVVIVNCGHVAAQGVCVSLTFARCFLGEKIREDWDVVWIASWRREFASLSCRRTEGFDLRGRIEAWRVSHISGHADLMHIFLDSDSRRPRRSSSLVFSLLKDAPYSSETCPPVAGFPEL